MLKIRRSRDRLIFNMGISIPGKDGLYIETGVPHDDVIVVWWCSSPGGHHDDGQWQWCFWRCWWWRHCMNCFACEIFEANWKKNARGIVHLALSVVGGSGRNQPMFPTRCRRGYSNLFLYSLSGQTSYRTISRSLNAARFGFRLFQSLWNQIGISAAALPRCLSNFRTIRSL